ncbi:MAG: cupin domain-containing protein [Candidatus Moraniibacteriota bacterium]|nr:MAG: cupin domain-containing protein [Candidatus Moranbacteria bacterium]
MPTSPYRRSIKILDLKPISIYIYFMVPGGIEKPHYHDATEIEYVFRGNTKTHQQGKFYYRNRGVVHEGVNDSKSDLIFLNIMIPAESENNTHYL